MRKFDLRQTCAYAALAAGVSLATPTLAQDAAEEEFDEPNTIVVTGTFIRGTPEDAALPVDVFTSEALSESGVSSPLEFIKDLPSVGVTFPQESGPF